MNALEWFGIVLASLNVLVSIRVIADLLSTPRQKILQLLIVWFLPVAGALLTLFMLQQVPSPTTHRTGLMGLAGAEVFGGYGTSESDRQGLGTGHGDGTGGDGGGD